MNNWGVVNINSVVFNWESGSLGDFMVIVNLVVDWGVLVIVNLVVDAWSVVIVDNWGVVIVDNWGGRLLDHFLMNNWSGFSVVMVMVVVVVIVMIMMMVIMMVMMEASVVTLFVVVVEEVEVVSTSDSIVVGAESVGKDGEVGSVVGFVDEHILDEVIGEVRVSLRNKLKSFLD
jgi:ABC-type multidrug transport system fused ATPase/permease subunit